MHEETTKYPVSVCCNIKVQRMRRLLSFALTEREKQILSLKKGDMLDYEIARKLRIVAGNVTRSKLLCAR